DRGRLWGGGGWRRGRDGGRGRGGGVLPALRRQRRRRRRGPHGPGGVRRHAGPPVGRGWRSAALRLRRERSRPRDVRGAVCPSPGGEGLKRDPPAAPARAALT